MDIEIVQAMPADAGLASSIMLEVAEWLKEQGQTLWFPEELTPEKLMGPIDAGELYLVMMQSRPVGTVIFQLHDKTYWPDMPEGDAAYIHKIIVRRSVAGQGLGAQIIAWAKEKAHSAGMAYLRLDTEAARAKLCALYESAGFIRHSFRQVGRHYVVRYEMEV
jgi:ribosomal protein S18 acetylase RimI-like enzyme